MYVSFLAVKVRPRSIKHKYPFKTCDTGFMEIPADKITSEFNITYSYSVKFEVSIIVIFLNTLIIIKMLYDLIFR